MAQSGCQSESAGFQTVPLPKNFNTLRAVLQFCRANDVFTVELLGDWRLKQEDPSHCDLPEGLGCQNQHSQNFPGWMKLVVPVLFDPLLGQTAAQAAEAALRLLLSDEYGGGNPECTLCR